MQISRHGVRALRIGGRVLVFGFAVSTLFVAYAQDAPAAPQPAGSPFRVSVVPAVTPGCGAAVSGADLQQYAESRLRGAGMTVSDVHNSQLAVDVDCVPVTAAKSAHNLAVHQCLGFSEVVSAAAGDSPMLASTWHKCESYVCESAYCEHLASSNETFLMDGFLSSLAERTAQEHARLSPPVIEAAANTVYERVIFFGLYTIACLTMGIYWQIRKRAEARVS
jgi:hypothetical protein